MKRWTDDLTRRIRGAIEKAPPERRDDVIELFQVWSDWHIPKFLRHVGVKAPAAANPSRPISVREARLLRDIETRFVANGVWWPGMPQPKSRE